ncbi:hypothetical protein [Candidatus Magnetominusculus xianensis]|uniref:DUF5659 domain-containing protein n=1 Tax=Candidatus Magnetominusculus xianensis TaxID=1748249 RepID=A0ABR5SJ74_9BACT|nr:hypothetical protein [Candidatus Magnetominusculus xianensis]KWT92036.1 hypothetical protein ASN18_0589 [Candidatus Magnetominusculus xianensis]MBF0404616.1 hypothetical protein [Nitrospirota bacterium]
MAKNKRIPIHDINLTAFLSLKGFKPELTINGNHVTFELPANDKVYCQAMAYNSNESVPVLDFVSSLRQLRAQMMALRGQNVRGGSE